MPENDKSFTQITLSFDPDRGIEATPEISPLNEIPDSPDSYRDGQAPINVGIRIKALKEAIQPVVNPQPVKVKSTRGRKSLKTVEAEAELVNLPEDEALFSRQYYSIGEVAEMFRVNTSLIRFWENEFDILQPRKNRKGDRHFRPVDIKNLSLIYDLLRRRKLTMEGAKDFLKKNKNGQEHYEMIESLRKIKGFLLELKASL
jgi:DNA-binding transcriptional MerR regulator